MSPNRSSLSLKQKKSLLKLSKQIIGINSTNPKGNLRLAQFIGERLKMLGFRISYQKVRFYGANQANLLAQIGPQRGKRLQLNTHLDTVVTNPKKWTKTGGNPFRAQVRNGVLYGLGSADTKLALACQLTALEGLDLSRLKRPLMITGTYGEELGLIGVEKLIKSPKVKAGFVLNSEPTGMVPCNANNGFRVYKIVGRLKQKTYSHRYICQLLFMGKEAHSATPDRGLNAIQQAFKWLSKQGKSVAALEITGGLEANIVAPHCEILLISPHSRLKHLRKYRGVLLNQKRAQKRKFRPLPVDYVNEFLRFLKKKKPKKQTNNLGGIKLENGNLEIIMDHRFGPDLNPNRILAYLHQAHLRVTKSEKGSFKIQIVRDNPPFYQKKGGRLVKEVGTVLKLLNRKTKLRHKPGCTEAGYFAQLGSEVLTIGPGSAYGNAHEPNECIRVKELEEAVVFYREMIGKFCLTE